MKVACFMFSLTGNCPYGKGFCKGEHIMAAQPAPKPVIKSKLKTGNEFRPAGAHAGPGKGKKGLKKGSTSFKVEMKQKVEPGKLRTGQSFKPGSSGGSVVTKKTEGGLMSMLGDSYSMVQAQPIQAQYPVYPMMQPNMFGYPGMGGFAYPNQMIYQQNYQNFQQNYELQPEEDQELEEFLEEFGYDRETFYEIVEQCAGCNCCGGNPINCPNCSDENMPICSCFLQIEAEQDIVSHQKLFRPEFADCTCCKGYVDDCNGLVCKDLGVCQCVVHRDMENDEIDFIEECKDCACCRGKVYECPQKLSNCQPGTCGCFM